MSEPLTSSLLGEADARPAVYSFIEVNGFIYRCNTVTGEAWRLQPDPADKKQQAWKRIEVAQ